MIKVVSCQHQPNGQKFLFRAPYDSDIERGDTVICDTRYGEQTATVCSVLYLNEDSEFYRMLIDVAGARHPLSRVIGKMERVDFDYQDARVTNDINVADLFMVAAVSDADTFITADVNHADTQEIDGGFTF